MAQYLRGKQAGIQKDLSAPLASELFALDIVACHGINSQISAIAYDPVQSLLAVGTNQSKFGGGQVYVFGQKRVCFTFAPGHNASIRLLVFCANRLLCVDSRNDISVFCLETKKTHATWAPHGKITALLSDPTLDYALVGLQSGEIVAYDIDRARAAPFKIPCLWKDFNPRARLVSVVALAFHPRDIGTLLIGYSDGAAIYSFKQNKSLVFLHYELQVSASGGFPDPTMASRVRSPKVVQAVWHPSGTFVLTGHDDSSLVVWDSKNGKMIQARTLQEANIDKRDTVSNRKPQPETFSLKVPLFRIAWCSKPNADDTGILVAGGYPTNLPGKSLTFLDLGQTPTYATSSWQILSDHFARPKAQISLDTPPNADVVDFCLIPRSSPHYAGGNDPIAVVALLASGELTTLGFPTGHPITPTNQLHPSLSFVHPFVDHIGVTYVDRIRWLGMKEKRSQGPLILRGGAEATHPLKRYESRNIIQTAHADGMIRIWDAGHGDEIENEDMIQVDVPRALGRYRDVSIATTSMSGSTGELAVGMKTGELAIFRWGVNLSYGKDIPLGPVSEEFGLEDISTRADPGLKEGLLPLTLMAKSRSCVTVVKMSDVGFAAAGFTDGRLAVIDLRGPALIYEGNLHELTKLSRRSSIRKPSGGQHEMKAEYATCLEFAVMSLEGEDYSSILLFLATNLGRFATFKLLPATHGGYSVDVVGSHGLESKIISIMPINADTGKPAEATATTVDNLRSGFKVNGVVILAMQTGVRVFKPPGAKGASKSWSDYLCDAASIVQYEDRGCALVALFGDGNARTYSLPGLKELASIKISHVVDPRRFPEAIISPTGDTFGWTGPSEVAIVNVWGRGHDTTKSLDQLCNLDAVIPPRPTISNLQWIAGTQYVTPQDMDILIGGPDRPPSKRMIEQARSDEKYRRAADRPGGSTSAPHQQDETYWSYMQRQVTERTEKLNFMGDSMNQLEEQSSSWAEDVNKFVGQQKKKAVMGMIGSKFGF